MSGQGDSISAVPSLDGSLVALISFERDLAWCVAGMDPENRSLYGPRIARALTGRAREVVTDMTAADVKAVASPDACKYLVRFIKDRLGEPPVGEVAKVMDQYFTHYRREKKESMGAYLARGDRLYHQLSEALERTTTASATPAPMEAAPSTSRPRDWLPELVC